MLTSIPKTLRGVPKIKACLTYPHHKVGTVCYCNSFKLKFVEVTFNVDSNGILEVTAEDLGWISIGDSDRMIMSHVQSRLRPEQAGHEDPPQGRDSDYK